MQCHVFTIMVSFRWLHFSKHPVLHLVNPPLSLNPEHWSVYISAFFPFKECHEDRIIEYIGFSDQLECYDVEVC